MYRKKKRIPTIFALFIISAIIGISVFLDKSLHLSTTSTIKYPVPEEIRFTNISDSSFNVSWFTDISSTGTIVVSDENQSLTFIDDLDSDNIPRPRNSHYITAKNLKENILYTVRLYGDSKKCSTELYCPTFKQSTSVRLPIKETLSPAKGSVITQDGKPSHGAIVYLFIGKNSPLSGISDSSGLWVIPLSNLYSLDLKERISLADNDIAQITIMNSHNQISSSVIDVKSIRQNLTIPMMQLGKSYNFINLAGRNGLFANSAGERVLGSQTQQKNADTTTGNNKLFDILFPLDDGDTTTDNKPRFRGIGPIGSQLLITVNSQPQIGRVVIDKDGTWVWRPQQTLSPGIHHINIQGYDESGNLINVTKKFIVLKSGEQVLGEATASATLTPTYIPPSPTVTPPLSLITPTSIQPTLSVTPLTPTVIPPSPSVYLPTTTPTVSPPRTGTYQLTLILLSLGIISFLSGVKLIRSS